MIRQKKEQPVLSLSRLISPISQEKGRLLIGKLGTSGIQGIVKRQDDQSKSPVIRNVCIFGEDMDASEKTRVKHFTKALPKKGGKVNRILKSPFSLLHLPS